MPEIKLRAAYTDGHVETWSASDAVPMRVSKGPEGVPPYDDALGRGIFFLPENAVR